MVCAEVPVSQVSNRIPLIKTVMTPFPYSVDINADRVHAREYIREYEIHHLPVTSAGDIVGIITADQLEQLAVDTVGDLDLIKAPVFDLNERLDNILEIMATGHIDTVLVTRNEKLVGIFTVTDACREFANFLREEFGPTGGDDAA